MSQTPYMFGKSAFVSMQDNLLPSLDDLTTSIASSSITTKLDYIYYGYPFPLTSTFYFSDTLSIDEQTALSIIISQHTGSLL
jgi:hypothetical protein